MSESQNSLPDYSEEFYRLNAKRYSEVSHQLLQSIYIKSSHPALKGDFDLLERLVQLAVGRRGLDAGCGAGARDVHYLWSRGFDVYGIDAVEENIEAAKELHPEISDRVSVADLRQPLDFPDESFDFILCNAVIQHIEPGRLFDVTLLELARTLRRGGILQLMFKNGQGVITVYDRDYDVQRSFQLYEEREILDRLVSLGLTLIEADDPNQLGGVMYFTDPKPVEHCVFYLKKRA
jgi:SAM-dependent methyltransferase